MLAGPEATQVGIEGDRFYSLPEIARILGTSRVTIYRRVGAGVIPASKAGRAFIVKGSDLKKALLSTNNVRG